MNTIISTPAKVDMQCIDRLPSGNYRLRMRVAKRPLKRIFGNRPASTVVTASADRAQPPAAQAAGSSSSIAFAR